MSARRTRSALCLAALGATLVLVPGAPAASSGAGYRTQAQQLGALTGTLDARTKRALLDLYALESQLVNAKTRLAALQSQAQALRARRAALSQELAAARATLVVSQQRLGDHLRTLYEQGSIDPIAVVLGAESLDDAISKLDALSRLADQNRQVVAVTLGARARLTHARVTLARQQSRLAASVAAARKAADTLGAARAERFAYVQRLRARQTSAHDRIHALLAAAQAVERKAQQIQAAATAPPADSSSDASPAPAPGPVQSGRQLRVSSTGYSLPGHTASGLPVGPGIVAVDPNVIPLGTRMYVPGYGEAVAADVGSAVKGYDIDLWFPTLAQARAWGRRTVVITLH